MITIGIQAGTNDLIYFMFKIECPIELSNFLWPETPKFLITSFVPSV
jgi:hypothetical protein